MAQKANRPRSATRRTLPPDPKSLADMVRSVHRHLLERAVHVKQGSHDFHARRGLQTFFEQRAEAWAMLEELDHDAAEALRLEIGLIVSAQEVA